jgi:VanZ family protein
VIRVLGLWGPLLAYMAMVFAVSSQSTPAGTEFPSDKLLHAVAYAGMALLASRALHGGLDRMAWAPGLGAVGVAVGYGALDEFHQAFVPGRQASVLDWVADAVGAIAAIVILAGVVSHRRRIATHPSRPR